eukprot:6178463-Pleurochrysis_carterae.AAC.2
MLKPLALRPVSRKRWVLSVVELRGGEIKQQVVSAVFAMLRCYSERHLQLAGCTHRQAML